MIKINFADYIEKNSYIESSDGKIALLHGRELGKKFRSNSNFDVIDNNEEQILVYMNETIKYFNWDFMSEVFFQSIQKFGKPKEFFQKYSFECVCEETSRDLKSFFESMYFGENKNEIPSFNFQKRRKTSTDYIFQRFDKHLKQNKEGYNQEKINEIKQCLESAKKLYENQYKASKKAKKVKIITNKRFTNYKRSII